MPKIFFAHGHFNLLYSELDGLDESSMGIMKWLCAKSILGIQEKIDIILKELIMLELFGNKQYYLA